MAITFTHDAFISSDDLSNDGQDIVVTNCNVTVDGPHIFRSLQVLNGAVLTHSPFTNGPQQSTSFVSNEAHVMSATNPATLYNINVDESTVTVLNTSKTTIYTENVDYVVTTSGQNLQLTLTTNSAIAEGATVLVSYDWTETLQGFTLLINNDVNVASGGAINVSGKGYGGGFGVGTGGSQTTNFPFTFRAGGGGGHGGAGGMSSTFGRGGSTYDSTTNPEMLGSGGGIGSSAAGGAGGGSATILVGGNFQIDGQILARGLNATNAHSGGGAGGSIFLSAESFSGAGSISANGGGGDTPDGGGGGGGRIALYFATNNFSGTNSAFGGGGAMAGGAGTIYLQADSDSVGQLFIVNGGTRGTNTTFAAAVSDLTISGGAVLQASTLPLSVTNLFLGSNSWLASPDSLPLTVTVIGNATVESNAVINADFKSSSGTGTGNPTCVAGGGASYGGIGGASVCGALGGPVYGSISQPSNLGSPGSPGVIHPRGGGAIRMTVGGTLSLAGKISANGAPTLTGFPTGGIASGSGSGGSVWLTVGALTGTGTISANGGSASNLVSGGGGGGRVAVYFDTNLFTGSITAQGGSGTNSGGPGSIYLKGSTAVVNNPGPIPKIIFDNGGLAGNTYLLSSLEKCDLVISGGAVLTNYLSTSITLKSLFIGSNSWLAPLPYPSAGLTATVTNVTIQRGGGIIANGISSSTTGAGRNNGFIGGGGGGGGYGGDGGTNSASGGTPVIKFVAPSVGGSIGGAAGGLGGGVISLTVPGMLSLDGQISANGNPGSNFNSGGGAGGAINLQVQTISGSGFISANGGAGSNLGGGGAGGAIALNCDTNLFSGPITAVGGSGANFGGAGFVYITPFAFGKNPRRLIINNGGNRGAMTPLGSLTDLEDLAVDGGAVAFVSVSFSVNLRNLLVGTNAILQIGSVLSSYTINVSSNLTVLASGWLNTDGTAPLAGGAGESLGSTGGGGGNAGTGGTSILGARGGVALSDSISTPATAGGRGGNGLNQIAGGSGGGAFRIAVNNTIRVDGRISADGVSATNFNSGGGAGGTVNLSAKTLSGSGVISASGGAGNSGGGGGGGGHISLSLTTNTFTGSMIARGGSGANYGGAGIIYISGNPAPTAVMTQIILDNGGVVGGSTPFFTTIQLNTSLTVKGGAILTNANLGQLQSLLVGSNSTWILSPQQSPLTVFTNATVEANGLITVDGLSLNTQSAGQTLPGKGGGGGGHGGYGGSSISNALGGNVTSDSITAPTGAGSIGGSGGGNGGGVIQLTVRGILQLDGKLSANGVTSPINFNSGGGSGGSISLSVGKLLGAGSISANGGAANNQGGGGGGGRIAIASNTNQFTGTITARGGAGANAGGAGTIFLMPSLVGGNGRSSQLIVDNGGARGTNTAILSSISLIDVIVTNGGTLSVGLTTVPTWNNLTISSNSALTLVSNFNTLHLQINSNLDLQAGGALTLDGQGFRANSGGGYGYGGLNSGGGAGHGGYGSAGNDINASGGTVYDSISTPTSAGSGGGSGLATSGSAGGGAAQLTVNGRCTINGILSANGGAANISGAGGGSGGSVYLTVGTIAGNGKILADGGNGDTFTSGGGGGGRIAIYFKTNLFTGMASAHGGAGAGLAGGAGTIYWKTNSGTFDTVAQLIVDNGGFNGTNTPMITPQQPFDFSRVALSIRNRGVVDSSGAFTLQSLSVGPDSTLMARSLVPLGLTVQGNVLVDTNGTILADAAGYNPGTGAGSGTVDFAGEGGGGGYGGAGGASFYGALGGGTYGSSNQPVNAGSPGGIDPIVLGYSQGGGAIRLLVNGSLTVNGNVSANGADGYVDGSGGGSGGSIWITAGKLFGNGSITANGGQGESFEGGGGGGGRIAIYLGTNSFAGNISAMGGGGASPGQDGTVYMPTSLLISGNVTNMIGAGVAGITLQPTGLASVISDTNGYYSVTVPPLWTGSITPTGNGIIIPSLRTFANLSLDTPDQNFLAATPEAFSLGAQQVDNTSMSFNWYGINGVTYQPMYSSNLVDWAPYGAPIVGSNGNIMLSLPMTNAPQMYYRLIITY